MLELLVPHTVRAAEAEKICARGLANIAYGATRTGMGESLGVLFASLAISAERRVSHFSP